MTRYEDVPVEVRLAISAYVHNRFDYVAWLLSDRELYRAAPADVKHEHAVRLNCIDRVVCGRCGAYAFPLRRVRIFRNDPAAYLPAALVDGVHVRISADRALIHRCECVLGLPLTDDGSLDFFVASATACTIFWCASRTSMSLYKYMRMLYSEIDAERSDRLGKRTSPRFIVECCVYKPNAPTLREDAIDMYMKHYRDDRNAAELNNYSLMGKYHPATASRRWCVNFVLRKKPLPMH